MAKRVQRRRGTTAEHSTFTGHEGELTVDTSKETVIVHDGSTAGGFPLAREDLSNVTNKIGVQQLNLAEGTNGQVLTTNGSGTLSFTTIDASSTAVGGDVTGTVGNIQIAANKVGIAELNVADGTANQVLKTNGSGTLSFTTITTDPTMGGDLSGAASNAQIVAGAVGTTELAADAVDGTKLADNACNSEHYTDGSIDTAHIANLQITTGLLAANAVTEAKITAQTITNASIFPGTIRSQEIENGTIVGTDIAANSIDGTKLALGSDTQGDIMYYDSANWVRLGPGTAGLALTTGGAGANPSWSQLPYDIAFTAGYDKDMVKEDVAVATYGELVMARAGTFVGEAGYIDTPATIVSCIVDIEKNGSSIYSSRPEYASGSNSLTAGTLSVTTFAVGDRISFKVDAKGNVNAGQGVRFTLKCKV